jgi:predicted acylesterase/phospholipase RssA
MKQRTTYSWILDSGGAGRGAWQGGVIHQFMKWTRENGCYPQVSMGASAGGYAAADIATGTEATVMKGWTQWGQTETLPEEQVPAELRSFWGLGQFRLHLTRSIRYVMGEREMAAVFDSRSDRKLLVFTTRVRRRDGERMQSSDNLRFFLKSLARKLPRPLKYLPSGYRAEPVVFATNLPRELLSEYVRPITRNNYHQVIEASCLIPLAMGSPLLPGQVNNGLASASGDICPGDVKAVFMDGGFTLKMPMAIFEEDARFQALARWTSADRVVIFCCDPKGNLWETSSRLRKLNSLPTVIRAVREGRLLLIHPDHKNEASALCHDNDVIMRAFHLGQEQGDRLLKSERVKGFFR